MNKKCLKNLFDRFVDERESNSVKEKRHKSVEYVEYGGWSWQTKDDKLVFWEKIWKYTAAWNKSMRWRQCKLIDMKFSA